MSSEYRNRDLSTINMRVVEFLGILLHDEVLADASTTAVAFLLQRVNSYTLINSGKLIGGVYNV